MGNQITLFDQLPISAPKVRLPHRQPGQRPLRHRRVHVERALPRALAPRAAHAPIQVGHPRPRSPARGDPARVREARDAAAPECGDGRPRAAHPSHRQMQALLPLHSRDGLLGVLICILKDEDLIFL